jgi:hypothetical protein
MSKFWLHSYLSTVGMFDNSYFDNSKSDKTDYVRRLEGLIFEKKVIL